MNFKYQGQVRRPYNPNLERESLAPKNMNLPYKSPGQKSSFQRFPKKLSHKPVLNLSIEEGAVLLKVWQRNNYADFNQWIQVAKAQIFTEIHENMNEISRNSKKFFTCNLTLTFDEDPNVVLISNGFAPNKKDARRMAIEKIVIDLIQNGEITRGLKNKDFLKENIKIEEEEARLPVSQGIDEGVQRKVQKLCKKMQEHLKNDSFLEACEILCQILTWKKPEWNEVICFD